MKRKLTTTVILGLVAACLMALPAGATGDCTTFENHSGHIPGSYDYAEFYEDGQLITTVETFGEDVFVNPAGFDAGQSWDEVRKCHNGTTTTTVEVTTTTAPEETSSLPSTTTTTEDSSATTTTTPAGTTIPETSTSTPTTQPVATTSASTPPELPFTGPAGVAGLLIAGLAAVGIGTVLVREFRSVED